MQPNDERHKVGDPERAPRSKMVEDGEKGGCECGQEGRDEETKQQEEASSDVFTSNSAGWESDREEGGSYNKEDEQECLKAVGFAITVGRADSTLKGECSGHTENGW